jgi:hypothetical protein
MLSQADTKPEPQHAPASEYIDMRVQITPSTRLDLCITGPFTAAVQSRLLDIVSSLPVSEPSIIISRKGANDAP